MPFTPCDLVNIKNYTPNSMNDMPRYSFKFCPIANTECLLDVHKKTFNTT